MKIIKISKKKIKLTCNQQLDGRADWRGHGHLAEVRAGVLGLCVVQSQDPLRAAPGIDRHEPKGEKEEGEGVVIIP